MWEALREYLEGYFFKEFLGLGLPKVIASASALVCAGSPVVFAARLRQQPLKEQQAFLAPGAPMTQEGTILGSSSGSSMVSSLLPSNSASQVGGGDAGSRRIAELEARVAVAEADHYSDRKDALGRCRWCMRTECLFVTGGRPCREYNQALNFSGEQRAQRREEAFKRPSMARKGTAVVPKEGE